MDLTTQTKCSVNVYKNGNLLTTITMDRYHVMKYLTALLLKAKHCQYISNSTSPLFKITTYSVVPDAGAPEAPCFLLRNNDMALTLDQVYQTNVNIWNSALYDGKREFYTLKELPDVRVDIL
jgi:hypothetical protein